MIQDLMCESTLYVTLVYRSGNLRSHTLKSMFTLQIMLKLTKSENSVGPGGGNLMLKTMSE